MKAYVGDAELILTWAVYRASDYLHIPAAFPLERGLEEHQVRGWVGCERH